MAQIAHAKMKGWLWVVLGVCVAGWFIGGCASYNVQTQKISQSYELGNIQAAASQISAEADKRGEGKDAVVWRLEQGAVLRAAERFEESNQAFDKAEELVNKYEEAAKMSVSREALATVTNLTTLPYEGFAYDKIMMNTYKALNYLQMGDSEKTRVEFNRAFQRQDDAVHINTKRIEKAQEEGSNQNLNVDIAAVNRDSKFKNQFENSYGDLDQFKAYAVYVNPLTVYLDGLYFMTHATGGSDLEHARKSFERVLGMIGENKYIRQDMETLQQVVSGKPIPATTYVFFETGQSPEREQIRIDLPLFIITPGVPYVGAAFPKLKYRSDYISALNVSYDGKTEAALLLSNMDAVVAREFKNELPTIITKTLIASAIKAGATYGAYAGVTKGGKKNTGAGLAVLIAGAIYQVAMNQADLRTWTTLPKEFHFCRFPTPDDRKIELEPPFSGYKLPVSVNDGLINVVWVKSLNRGSPLLVSQFKLKDETKGVVALPPPPEAVTPKEAPQQEPPKTEQTPQMQQPEASKPEQAVQPSQPAATGKEQPIQDAQPETPKSGQPASSLQSEAPVPIQSTQMPQQEPAKPDGATQENKPETSTEQLAQPSQLESSKSESSTQKSKPEFSKAEESTQSENTQSSNKQELPVDTALRFERERILAMGDAKARQIALLEIEGSNFFKKRDWNSVVSVYKKVLEIDPEHFGANADIGSAYLCLREFDLSLKYLTKATQLMPTHPALYYNLMCFYAIQGNKERTMEFLQKAVDRGFKDINHLKNDTDIPEDFKNDPRFIEITKHLE